MFLIQSGILARGVEVEAMDVSEGPPPRKRGRPFTTGKIGGGAYCSAVGCHNNEGRDRARGIKFYRFPKDNKRCKEWITKVNRAGPTGSLWTPSRAARLCSEHFVGGEKNENPSSLSYVPTVFTNGHIQSQVQKPADKARLWDKMPWPVEGSWQKCPPRERLMLPEGWRRLKDFCQDPSTSHGILSHNVCAKEWRDDDMTMTRPLRLACLHLDNFHCYPLKVCPWKATLVCELEWKMLQFDVHIGKSKPALSEIWQPWHAFFGNPEKQISDFMVFNHKYGESDIIFLIRVPIMFEICWIFMNMATLKIKICVLV